MSAKHLAAKPPPRFADNGCMAFPWQNASVMTPPRAPAYRRRHSWRMLAAFVSVFTAAQLPALAQRAEGPAAIEGRSTFLTVGAENTQLPFYADNALGFDSGVSFQRSPLLGVEFRAGAYPVAATYLQIPFTAGYRAVGRSLFGFPYNPYVYAGGGISRSQDRGARRLPGYPPHWYSCWQVDVGFDRTYHRYAWRVAQASWRETSTPLHSLRSVSLSTGIAYHFAR